MIAEAASAHSKQAQRLLRLYHLYRLSVGITLVLLISSNMDNRLLTSANDDLLRSGSWLYLVLNILLVVFFENTRRPAQLFTLALVDVLMLCGLFYAAGGVVSAIGNLLIVSVAISNTLLRRRIGLLIAAIVALGIIGLSFLLSFSHPLSANEYLQAGTLGALCFAAALLVQGSVPATGGQRRHRRTRASEVVDLEELNALILQRMRTGILVLDEQRRVLLANQSALTLLGAIALARANLIDDVFTVTGRAPAPMAEQPYPAPASLTTSAIGPELRPGFIALTRGSQPPHPGVSRRPFADLPTGPTTQARCAGPPDRRHRPRDPQSAGRHQPCRAAAARVRGTRWRGPASHSDHSRSIPADESGDRKRPATVSPTSDRTATAWTSSRGWNTSSPKPRAAVHRPSADAPTDQLGRTSPRGWTPSSCSNS